MTKYLFNASAVTEILTAVALLLAPGLVIELLFNFELNPSELVIARVLGVALLSLGVGTWTMVDHPTQSAQIGLFIYNLGVAGLLMVFLMMGETQGLLLWPATGIHGLFGMVMLVLLLRSFVAETSSAPKRDSI